MRRSMDWLHKMFDLFYYGDKVSLSSKETLGDVKSGLNRKFVKYGQKTKISGFDTFSMIEVNARKFFSSIFAFVNRAN